MIDREGRVNLFCSILIYLIAHCSSYILQKSQFMQRKMEAELRRQKEEEQNKAFQESHWVLGEEDSSDALLVEEAVDISDTGGRRSFKNFNPTVEVRSLSLPKRLAPE